MNFADLSLDAGTAEPLEDTPHEKSADKTATTVDELKNLQLHAVIREAEIDRLRRANEETREEIENVKNELAYVTKEQREKEKESVATSGTLIARFNQISQLSFTKVYSPSVKIAGEEWSICIHKHPVGCDDYLGVYVKPMSLQPGRMYDLFCTFKLIKVRVKGECLRYEVAGRFDATSNPWGVGKFVKFETLLNGSNEYVRSDSILVQIDIEVEPPTTYPVVDVVDANQSDRESVFSVLPGKKDSTSDNSAFSQLLCWPFNK